MAFCAYCGNQLSDSASACPSCGHPTGVGPDVIVSTHTQKPPEGFAVASLVSAIAGFSVLPFIGCILAVVFGNMAMSKLRDDPSKGGEGLARAGIVVGWIGIGLTIGSILLMIFVFSLFTSPWT
jgi:hypothetical protein